MKIQSLVTLSAVFLILLSSCSKEDMAPVETTRNLINLHIVNETDWEMAHTIHLLMNQHRASQGLEEVEMDRGLVSALATAHTKYMINLKRICHDRIGERRRELIDKGAHMVGENVAFGYENAESVVRAWINSPRHRENLEGNYTHCGYGIVKDASGTYYFTQLFYRK
ncbi:MAG: hypothetical protein Aureis2KO_26020 [Aureisphaera sp.]